MKSLLYKDLMNLKQQLRFYAIILVFYAVIGVRQGDMSFLGMVMAIFAVMLSVTAYAYDERAGWDKYRAYYAIWYPGTRLVEIRSGSRGSPFGGSSNDTG